MKYSEEYRDAGRCRKVAGMINEIIGPRPVKVMEVCGTHTAAIRKFGIKEMLSPRMDLISGPGCPVCVTSDGYLENAISLARKKDVILATYPDMIRVPAGKTSLEKERASGADVRGVMSAFEALTLAKNNPSREIVFLAVGFETTAPGTALAVMQAQRERIANFSVHSAHKTIPEALILLGRSKDLAIDAFLLPGHVSAIIGVRGYDEVVKKSGIPSIISGFEPLDILLSLYKLVQAINSKKSILENEYGRIVRKEGNVKARALLGDFFEKKDSVWRGLGVIKKSGLTLSKRFRAWDAVKKFSIKDDNAVSRKTGGCLCADVLKGKIRPTACPLFAKVCTPESPQGACMVSREGTCRAYYEYK